MRGNQIPRSNSGMGRTAVSNHRQGHFQDQARQLTSSAIGRAILWNRYVAVLIDYPVSNQATVLAVLRAETGATFREFYMGASIWPKRVKMLVTGKPRNPSDHTI